MVQAFDLPDNFERKTLETPSGKIAYWSNGRFGRSKFCLVFLPGLTADHSLFSPQLYCFAKTHGCIVWDAPAHGESRPYPLDFTLKNLAEYVHDILQAEKAERPVLVGQSLGGYIAQAFISAYPGEAAGLVSVDSGPLKQGYVSGSGIWALRHTKTALLATPQKALTEITCDYIAETESGRIHMRQTIEQYEKREFCELTAHGYRILADALSEKASEKTDREIDCPAVLICGNRDRAGDILKMNKEWSKNDGVKIVWIPRSGHNSTIDNPSAVNRAIRLFLFESVENNKENSGFIDANW